MAHKRKVSIKAIESTVQFRVGPTRDAEMSRNPGVVRNRHLAMYVAFERGHTLSKIGAHWSMDHTTVLHGRDKIAQLKIRDVDVRRDLTAINMDLDGATGAAVGVIENALRQLEIVQDLLKRHLADKSEAV